MSDQELVTFNAVQFAQLHTVLVAISNGLWAINDRLKEGRNESQVLKALNNIERKVDSMSSNIDRIEKEAADAAENVEMVKTALGTLNTTVSDLKATVADLQAQVEKGQLDQARLDAAASALEKADDDLDALVLPPTPSGDSEGGGNA